MRKLHCILPMAGRGSRFAKAGFTLPKPLIPVDGQPMFQKAFATLKRIDVEQRYTVILRKEHIQKYSLDSLIKEALPSVNILVTDEQPKGALCDAYRARPFIGSDEGILIMDCDIAFKSTEFASAIRANLAGLLDTDAAVMIFKADRPLYTYAQIDETGQIITTAEKKVISPHAIAGGHYFSNLKIFDTAAQAVLARPLDEQHPEYYVSYMYNEILNTGGRITSWPGEFTSFGTPQELAEYETAKKEKYPIRR